MSRKRDWVDYANLTSSIGQNIQLGGFNSALDELRSFEALKAHTEGLQNSFRRIILCYEDEFIEIKNQTSALSKVSVTHGTC